MIRRTPQRRRGDAPSQCTCRHTRDEHRRGWGPCTVAGRIEVIDADGGVKGGGAFRCDCRRFDPIATHPVVGRNAR